MRCAPDGVLVLRAPFEPVPLYRVLARRGFAHWTESSEADGLAGVVLSRRRDGEPAGGAPVSA